MLHKLKQSYLCCLSCERQMQVPKLSLVQESLWQHCASVNRAQNSIQIYDCLKNTWSLSDAIQIETILFVLPLLRKRKSSSQTVVLEWIFMKTLCHCKYSLILNSNIIYDFLIQNACQQDQGCSCIHNPWVMLHKLKQSYLCCLSCERQMQVRKLSLVQESLWQHCKL